MTQCNSVAFWLCIILVVLLIGLAKHVLICALIRVRSKLEVQNSSTFQGPKLHFSSTKIIDKKPYPRRGHSKFRLQCDTEVYCTVVTNTVMIKAKFQNLQDLNLRIFQGFSSTFKHLICFQALSRALKFLFQIQFKHFQGFLKHTMNRLMSEIFVTCVACTLIRMCYCSLLLLQFVLNIFV